MSILQYKYKAHKFVNYIFYIIVFVIGFLLGFSTEKIDFSKLLSQVLMIENVSAISPNEFEWDSSVDSGDYTTSCYNLNYSDISVKPTNTTYYDEDYIYNLFNETIELTSLSFLFDDYSNVFSIYHNSGVWNDYYFYFSSDEYGGNYSKLTTNKNMISIYISKYKSTAQICYISLDDGIDNSEIIIHNGSFSGSSQMATTSSNITVGYTLDFIGTNLKFNENLFKDNPDFKEVCVDIDKPFAITSTQMSDINSAYDFDYIWFPYNLNGLYKILYDNSVDTNEIHYTKEESTERYFFNTKSKIDSYYEDVDISNHLQIKGYTNKYSYYGWSAFPFRVYYSESFNQFNIFWIENPTKIYIGNLGSGGNVHGGGGTRLDFDEEIEIDKYCFYIKNIYEVTEVNLDEFNDFYGTVPTPNGDLEFSTSYNENNLDSGGLMLQVNKFISHIKGTIDFIRDTVYSFYLSLPLLVRMFLISLFVILIVKFIIGMVVR